MEVLSVFYILRILDENGAWYELQRYCGDTIDSNITFPGVRLEISCRSSGDIEYSMFEGSEEVFTDIKELQRLIEEFGEKQEKIGKI